VASPLQAAITAFVRKTWGNSELEPEARLRKLWEEMEELVRAWGDRPLPIAASPEIIDEIGDVYLCLLAFGASLGIDVENAGAAKMKALGSRIYAYDELKGWYKVGG